MGWTEEKVGKLTALYENGYTSGEIANLMSDCFAETFTRNAIMGKLCRLKLKRPARLEPPAIKPSPLPPPKPTPYQGEPLTDRAIVEAGARSLVALKPDRCKWPLGGWPEATPISFCGDRALDGLPYCREHCRISYGWAS